MYPMSHDELIVGWEMAARVRSNFVNGIKQLDSNPLRMQPHTSFEAAASSASTRHRPAKC
jgi:hypothetical protein